MMERENTCQKGRKGEKIACGYLEENSFEILDCNWRYHHLEMDIVARKNGILHIIEVKYRSYGGIRSGEEAVDYPKQKRLIRAANAYVRLHHYSEEISLDILAIDYYPDGSIQIRHLQHAFYPF